MKTNKIYTICCAVFAMVFLSGCNDWLDMRPENEVVLEQYWQSESDVEGVLAACYRGLIEDDVIYRMFVWGEMRSDNITVGMGFPEKRKDMLKILEGDLTQTNAYSSWGSFYSVINYCNTLLHYAPYVVERDNNFTEDDLHQVQSEALTIRALCYFYLVRSFKDVPLILDASIDDSQNYNLKKSTDDVVIAQIKIDLLEAKKYAKKDYGSKIFNKGRVTLNFVNALLADVYLWNQEYEKCVSICDEVLTDKKLKLYNKDDMFPIVFYSKNSDESIFELQFDDETKYNEPLVYLYGGSGNSLGECAFPAALAYNAKEEVAGAYSPFNYKLNSSVVEGSKDIRATESYRLFGGAYFIFKYAGVMVKNDTYYYRMNTANWILYRLSDIYLMKAEALAEVPSKDAQVIDNNLEAAVRLVNKTYLRSNSPADSLYFRDYSNKGEVERLILRERQREFLFEGKRWYDLVRLARREGNTNTLNDYVNHKATNVTSSLGASVPDAMYMPISKSELLANPAMEQNSYYNESN